MDALQPYRLAMSMMVRPDHALTVLDAAHQLAQQVDREAGALRPMVDRAGPPGGYEVQDGTALIRIMGGLITKTGFVGPRYGVTGYDGIVAEVDRAVADDVVQRIALLIDSPGGMARNCDVAATAIRAARDCKPVLAVVDGWACSAAYMLAAQANTIAMGAGSEVGHIGVIFAHMDVTGAMEKAGLKVTLLTSGAHKADMHPLNGPMSDDVRSSAQARLDKMRRAFAAEVGAGRPKLGTKRALATEAECYDGEEAVKAGLADVILQPAEALSRFAAGTIGARPSTPPRARPGATTSPAPTAGATPETPSMTTYAEGEQAAQTRIATILDSPHAKGRDALARRLAFKSTMSAEDAIATLQDAAQATSATADRDTLAARAGGTEQTLELLAGAAQAHNGRGSGAGMGRQKATIDTPGIYAARRKEMGQL